MPSLVKRVDEFEDIVIGIMGEITRELHKDHIRALSPETMERFRSYDWPGNIRELRNVLRLAVGAAKNNQIEATDLPDFGCTRIDFRATREQFEKLYILELLKTYDWKIDKTCKMSGMDKATLIYKIKDYGIALKQS